MISSIISLQILSLLGTAALSLALYIKKQQYFKVAPSYIEIPKRVPVIHPIIDFQSEYYNHAETHFGGCSASRTDPRGHIKRWTSSRVLL
jgi:hypothetical protein